MPDILTNPPLVVSIFIVIFVYLWTILCTWTSLWDRSFHGLLFYFVGRYCKKRIFMLNQFLVILNNLHIHPFLNQNSWEHTYNVQCIVKYYINRWHNYFLVREYQTLSIFFFLNNCIIFLFSCFRMICVCWDLSNFNIIYNSIYFWKILIKCQ